MVRDADVQSNCILMGTLDLTASPDSYPSLAPTHLIKLKHLTLVSLALQHRVCSSSLRGIGMADGAVLLVPLL